MEAAAATKSKTTAPFSGEHVSVQQLVFAASRFWEGVLRLEESCNRGREFRASVWPFVKISRATHSLNLSKRLTCRLFDFVARAWFFSFVSSL